MRSDEGLKIGKNNDINYAKIDGVDDTLHNGHFLDWTEPFKKILIGKPIHLLILTVETNIYKYQEKSCFLCLTASRLKDSFSNKHLCCLSLFQWRQRFLPQKRLIG